MSQVCIADALRATQIQLSSQQMFSYWWNHCSVCSISMLEYAGKTNTKHTADHMFITKVIIQAPTLFDFSYIYPFIFLTYFSIYTLTWSKSKQHVVVGVFYSIFTCTRFQKSKGAHYNLHFACKNIQQQNLFLAGNIPSAKLD